MLQLSEYEQLRARTIAQNNEKLRELGLADGGSALLPTKRVARAAKRLKAEAPAAAPPPPSRRSARVRAEAAPKLFVADEDASGALVLGGADAPAVRRAPAAFDPDALPLDVDDLRPAERHIYEELRVARNARARAMERSMFIVANDRTLCEMTRAVPTTADELGALFGMGPKKLAAHGALLLDALRPHADALRADHAQATREAATAAAAAADAAIGGGGGEEQGDRGKSVAEAAAVFAANAGAIMAAATSTSCVDGGGGRDDGCQETRL